VCFSLKIDQSDQKVASHTYLDYDDVIVVGVDSYHVSHEDSRHENFSISMAIILMLLKVVLT